MVKQGYKQTEIGVIPEDWDYGVFSSFVKLRHGFQFLEHHFSLSGVPVIKIGTLKDSGGIDVNKFTFVSEEIFEKFKSIQLFKGDVVMALTGATLGKVSKVDYNERCLQNYRVGLFNGIVGVDNNFIYHILQSFLVQKTVKELVNSGAQPNLGKADFDKIIIPLPPLPEQEAIAEALSDADAWIASLEQIIVKKRLIKQGAMQTLLTPKDDWEVKKLGEVVNFKNGAAHENVVDENGEYVIVNSKFISQEGRVRKHSNAFLCPLYKHEITMVMSDIPNGKALAKCFIIDKDDTYTLNQRICAFEAKEGFDSKYLYYKINRNDYFLAFDSGSGQTNLRRDDVLSCPIDFPSLSEQERIATILSDMDAELEALEKQLGKARQIKQGMMQELLTGRTRLV